MASIPGIVTIGLLCLVVSPVHAQYPDDPTSDIPWNPPWNGVTVADIEQAFNDARDTEGAQLGIVLPDLVMPEVTAWDSMSPNEKALFLVNSERMARGVPALEGYEENMTTIAQGFAQWLLDNNEFGHAFDWDDDGAVESPWDRLDEDPIIGPCHDFLGVAETIAIYLGAATEPPDEVVARTVYNWTFNGSTGSWAQRHVLLWEAFNDNGGEPGIEGLMGIGVASGGPYEFPGGPTFPHATLVVWNVFDPCATWDYGETSAGPEPLEPSAITWFNSAPNPASRGVSTLRFALDHASQVEVAIFETGGRLVRSLYDQPLNAGDHQMVWDGTDRRGRPVAPGVYYYRIMAGEHRHVDRLVVLR